MILFQVQQAAEKLIREYNTVAMQFLKRDAFHESKMLLRKAIACTKDANYICHRSARLHLRAVTLNNMGCYCKRAGKLDSALEYLQKALGIESRLGGGENPAGTHLNICAVL